MNFLPEAIKTTVFVNGARYTGRTVELARNAVLVNGTPAAEVPPPPCDMGKLCIGCQPRCSPPVAEDTPLETGEADARELPPEVAAKFVTTL